MTLTINQEKRIRAEKKYPDLDRRLRLFESLAQAVHKWRGLAREVGKAEDRKIAIQEIDRALVALGYRE